MFETFKTIGKGNNYNFLFSITDPDAVVTPPAKRPNKDPMPSHRPTPEQYAAMISAAAAAGQPLPKHHVSDYCKFEF